LKTRKKKLIERNFFPSFLVLAADLDVMCIPLVIHIFSSPVLLVVPRYINL
jgi:hypothetical protein